MIDDDPLALIAHARTALASKRRSRTTVSRVERAIAEVQRVYDRAEHVHPWSTGNPRFVELLAEGERVAAELRRLIAGLECGANLVECRGAAIDKPTLDAADSRPRQTGKLRQRANADPKISANVSNLVLTQRFHMRNHYTVEPTTATANEERKMKVAYTLEVTGSLDDIEKLAEAKKALSTAEATIKALDGLEVKVSSRKISATSRAPRKVATKPAKAA